MVAFMLVLMPMIWTATITCNVVLALLLLWREHYIRYGWLTASVVFSVFADFVLWRVHQDHHGTYAELSSIVYWLCLGFNGLIIWESFLRRNRGVRVPVELQLGVELVAFLVHRAQFLWTAYYLQCGLRVSNFLMILYFIWMFRGEKVCENRRRKENLLYE